MRYLELLVIHLMIPTAVTLALQLLQTAIHALLLQAERVTLALLLRFYQLGFHQLRIESISLQGFGHHEGFQ